MLTRLEIDGFKNLCEVKIDFGPFTCIAGPNGVGKSNLFDAIEFLSLLATHKIMDAAQLIRRSDSDRSADPRDLFWTDGDQRSTEMRFAAEMIVPETAMDAFRREAKATMTFLRYELAFGYVEPTGLATHGQLVLRHESLVHINKGDAHRHLRFRHSKKRVSRHSHSGEPARRSVYLHDRGSWTSGDPHTSRWREQRTTATFSDRAGAHDDRRDYDAGFRSHDFGCSAGARELADAGT